MKHVFYFE